MFENNLSLHVTNKQHTTMRKFTVLTILFISMCFSCQKTPTENKLSQKIWLHRANDIKKAQYFQDKYAGLEIDITYIDSLKTFLVQHGGGLHEPNPVTLEHWFDALEKANKLGLWLDFKNLNDKNKTIALNELNRICSQYKIKRNKIIVENWSPKNLSVFYNAGYKTSYYIPDFNPKESTAEDIQRYTNEIRRNSNSYNTTTISGYYYQYQFMRDSFPDKDILIWYHLNDKKIQNEYIQIADNDDKVNVLLIAEEIPNSKN